MHEWMLKAVAPALGAIAIVSTTGHPLDARAQEQLAVYAVPGLFGPENSACGRAGEASYSTQIHEAYCGQFALQQRAVWGQQFSESVARHFANVINSLDMPPPEGVTREAMLGRTAIASLHLSRADIWIVPKPSTVDVYRPLTMTLMITNVMTGEVIFSDTLNVITSQAMRRSDYLDQAVEQLPELMSAHIEALVQQAAARFRPYPIQARVTRRLERGWAIDAGRRQGLSEGDTFGADARVIYADADYAVVEPVLGTLAVGQQLARQVTRPVETLARPSVSLIVDSSAAQLPSALARTVAQDALGESSVINLAPVNPDHAVIREQAIGTAGVAYRPRPLPDYIMRVSFASMEPAETSTNVVNVRRRTYQGWTFIELVDLSGRVVFATSGIGDVTDEFVGEMTFSDEQRREVALRNAMANAAEALNRDFRPRRQQLEIGSRGGEVAVLDPGNSLSPGTRGVLLRRDGNIWAPAGDVEVVSLADGHAGLRNVGLEDVRPRRGDRFAVQSSGVGHVSRETLSICTDENGKPQIDRRGNIEQPLFGRIAENSFAAGFRGAVRLPGLDQQVRTTLAGQFGDVSTINWGESTLCFRPVHQVIPRSNAIRGVGEQSFDLTMGYVVLRDTKRVTASGQANTLTPANLPPNTDAATQGNILQMDLARQASRLMLEAARNTALTP